MTPRTLQVQIELDDTSADADRIAKLIERTLHADPFVLNVDAKAVSVVCRLRQQRRSELPAMTVLSGPARHRGGPRACGHRMGGWAPVMDAQINDRAWCAARLAAGDTVAAIGQAAGVSRQTASAWLKRHGLQANNQPKPRPDAAQLAGDYERTRSMRKLAAEYGISPAVMRTWLFEAGVDPLGTPGRPPVDVDVADVQARRARGETWQTIADELHVSVETLRRRATCID